MAEYHPLIVHFPLASLTLYVFAEAAGYILKNDKLRFTAQLLLITGVVTGIAAVLSGNQSAYSFNELNKNIDIQIVKEAIETHETYATILLWYFFLLLAARTWLILQKTFTKIKYVAVVVFAVFGLYFIWLSGHYGGELVFEHGVGTKTFNQKSID